MTARFLSQRELRELLDRQGHEIVDSVRPVPDDTDVCPATDHCVVVASWPKLTGPDYRQRYFTFRREQDLRPLPPCDHVFPLPAAYRELADRHPPESVFDAGPLRWLLWHLRQSPEVLLWPRRCTLSQETIDDLSDVYLGSPHMRGLHRLTAPEGKVAGAVFLDQANPQEAQVLWSAAHGVSPFSGDMYVSDSQAAVVYWLSHHNEIFISAPRQAERDQLMVELKKRSEMVLDCSGYTTEMDEKFWPKQT